MSSGPLKGPVNGEEASAVLRRAAAAQALDQAFPAKPVDGMTWPQVAAFMARELPKAKLHASQASTFEAIWVLKCALVDPAGYVIGLRFSQGTTGRELERMLRTAADRVAEIAHAVENGLPVPEPRGAKPVDISLDPAKPAPANDANPAEDAGKPGGGNAG